MGMNSMHRLNERAVTESHFATDDGVELFYRHWPASGTRRGTVVMFHRGHEHSGRMAHLVDELDLPDFDVFAWDARGHGRSPGERGFSPSFGPRCAMCRLLSIIFATPMAWRRRRWWCWPRAWGR
jgi:alpha-beta hydrolase superfamily lysophospholipase